jgi:thiamine-phosphate pyrophosphorylase
MAEVKHRSRLYFQFPMQPSAKLEAQLAQAIESTEAACVLLCGDDQTSDKDHLSRLVDLVQSRGLACLVENDIALAEHLGADGVHLAADPEAYSDARARLGESANIGVDCGLSRHHAMLFAESGADYVAFSAPPGTGINGIDQCAELISWWAELFVVPCVAWNVESARDAARFAALGADFIAPSSRLWHEPNAQQLIAEIDSAVRQARRAA